MSYQVLKGTHDVILDEAFSYSYIESLLAMFAETCGFKEFRVPVIEKSDLFTRAVGQGSDVVRKEMYTFLDKGNRSVTLRPEFTAGIIRSMVNAKLFAQQDFPIKGFYYGPVFRYERPQLGRYRQFNQFGVESVGSDSYFRDVEVILFGYHGLQFLGLNDVVLKVNSLGDEESRTNYRNALIEYFSKHIDEMCSDCKERLNVNPLRILDCKVEEDRKIIENAPKIDDYLSEASKKRFKAICDTLDFMEVKYEVDHSLVRGLDYYSETVFEYHYTSSTGNNYGAVGGGGHYSNLVKEIGGPALPGVGLSFGVERLFSILKDDNKLPEKPALDAYVMPVTKNDVTVRNVLTITDILRTHGFKVEVNLEGNSFSSMFKKAEKKNALLAVIIGDDEIDKDMVKVKDLSTREEVELSLGELIPFIEDYLSARAHKHEHDHECSCGHHHHHDYDCECGCDGDCDCDCENGECECDDESCCCGHHHHEA